MSTTLDADARRRDLAMIHLAAKQLGMDESAYRDMLWTVARVRSAGDLDFAGRQRVKDHLKACGFTPAPSKKPARRFPGEPHNVDQHPQLKKIRALLTEARRPWSYADAMAKRMFGKERVAFCDPGEWQRLIAALVIDQNRRRENAKPHEPRP